MTPRRSGFAVVMLVGIACLPGVAVADVCYSVKSRIPCVDAVVEARLTFDRPVPRRWKPNWTFPDALAARAKARARIEPVVGPEVAASQIRWFDANHELSTRAWWLAHKRGEVTVLVFLRRSEDGTWAPVLAGGVCGYPNDVEPLTEGGRGRGTPRPYRAFVDDVRELWKQKTGRAPLDSCEGDE